MKGGRERHIKALNLVNWNRHYKMKTGRDTVRNTGRHWYIIMIIMYYYLLLTEKRKRKKKWKRKTGVG